MAAADLNRISIRLIMNLILIPLERCLRYAVKLNYERLLRLLERDSLTDALSVIRGPLANISFCPTVLLFYVYAIQYIIPPVTGRCRCRRLRLSQRWPPQTAVAVVSSFVIISSSQLYHHHHEDYLFRPILCCSYECRHRYEPSPRTPSFVQGSKAKYITYPDELPE